jgi:hypothetical protein
VRRAVRKTTGFCVDFCGFFRETNVLGSDLASFLVVSQLDGRVFSSLPKIPFLSAVFP